MLCWLSAFQLRLIGVIFGYGTNASDRRLKTNIRRVPDQQYYDRIGGCKEELLALNYWKLSVYGPVERGEKPAKAGGMKRASEQNLVVLLDKWSACWKQRRRTRAIGPML
ncbi:hypothetical protein AK812_SmicGene47309 [Symbiodinium microadriaticum]|uniref:Uncharacterized protein n=1 Tax=Symbiodinium microadriaticum TaxID=2951 RepID=A0A1Q9BRY4_SYMMI|nr:hypothetical protein AK812_SmicGene47309 [Symbiodinium microadriaticum]